MKARGLLSLITFSEKRREILLLLQDGPKTLDEIKDYFKATTPEILPRIKELENNDLIYQEGKKYFLTEIGEVITKSFARFFKTLEIFERDMKFWKDHQISGIPGEFLLRLYELGDYQVFKSTPIEIFKPHDEYVKNLLKSNWIKGVSPVLHPDYPKVFITLAKKGVRIALILTRDVLEGVKKEHKEELKRFLGYKYTKIMAYPEEIKVAFTVSDCFFSMRLFLKSGEYDFYKNIISYEKSALKFGEELFRYYERRSEKVGVQDF